MTTRTLPQNTTARVVRVPTLRPRLADDWDTLCLRLASSSPANTVAREDEVVARVRATDPDADVRWELDAAWSHGRNLRRNCRTEDVSGWVVDAAGVRVG